MLLPFLLSQLVYFQWVAYLLELIYNSLYVHTYISAVEAGSHVGCHSRMIFPEAAVTCNRGPYRTETFFVFVSSIRPHPTW